MTGQAKRGPATWSDTKRWAVASICLAALLLIVVWVVVTDAPIVRFLVRLYQDKHFLKETVRSWGWMAPLVFIAIQALQVIISPIPGEITGPVGGALFGTLWGVIYSTLGLTAGTLICFALGRLWGEPLIRPWLSEHHWEKMNFVIEAEGAILCFILYLIPGFPKDIISYLFGMSPMPFWVFAVVSTVGRLPGTWISSYFGAHVGDRQYIYAMVFIAIIAALCLPIYYYRDRIVKRFQRKRQEFLDRKKA
ncbi:MAG TPA: TVP38/TMEM64 family protein [Methylomirabilota bacterium]|nr:TVP38/TMEM64 family protein [Methylomirabilota bacterium]